MNHGRRATIPPPHQVLIESTGIVIALTPATGEVLQGRGQLGGPRMARRMRRRLINRPVPTDGATVQPQGRRELPRGLPSIPTAAHLAGRRAGVESAAVSGLGDQRGLAVLQLIPIVGFPAASQAMTGVTGGSAVGP